MKLKPSHNINYRTYVIHRIMRRCTTTPAGCIEYQTGKLKHKYGVVSFTFDGKRKNVPVHRAMYMASDNCFDLPSYIVIRHTCDNPRCVNLQHLLPGTHGDNAKDKIERGRVAKKHKLHTRQCKLTDKQIKKIRNSIGKDRWIAEEFGISPGYVWKIRNMKAKTLV